MTRLLVVLLAVSFLLNLIFLGVIVRASVGDGGRKASVNPEPPAMTIAPAVDPVAPAQGTPGPVRIGVVTIAEIFDGYRKTMDLDANLQGEIHAARGRLVDLNAEVRKVAEELKSLPDGSPSHRAALLRGSELEYRKQALELECTRAIDERKAALADGIKKEIADEIGLHCRSIGIDLVLERQIVSAARSPKEKGGARFPVAHYAKPELDLTQAILQRLNARYVPGPVSPGPPPSPPR